MSIEKITSALTGMATDMATETGSFVVENVKEVSEGYVKLHIALYTVGMATNLAVIGSTIGGAIWYAQDIETMTPKKWVIGGLLTAGAVGSIYSVKWIKNSIKPFMMAVFAPKLFVIKGGVDLARDIHKEFKKDDLPLVTVDANTTVADLMGGKKKEYR